MPFVRNPLAVCKMLLGLRCSTPGNNNKRHTHAAAFERVNTMLLKPFSNSFSCPPPPPPQEETRISFTLSLSPGARSPVHQFGVISDPESVPLPDVQYTSPQRILFLPECVIRRHPRQKKDFPSTYRVPPCGDGIKLQLMSTLSFTSSKKKKQHDTNKDRSAFLDAPSRSPLSLDRRWTTS